VLKVTVDMGVMVWNQFALINLGLFSFLLSLPNKVIAASLKILTLTMERVLNVCY